MFNVLKKLVEDNNECIDDQTYGSTKYVDRLNSEISIYILKELSKIVIHYIVHHPNVDIEFGTEQDASDKTFIITQKYSRISCKPFIGSKFVLIEFSNRFITSVISSTENKNKINNNEGHQYIKIIGPPGRAIEIDYTVWFRLLNNCPFHITCDNEYDIRGGTLNLNNCQVPCLKWTYFYASGHNETVYYMWDTRLTSKVLNELHIIINISEHIKKKDS